MKELRIGQVVSFDHIADPRYDDKDERTIVNQRIKPMHGVVVGIAVKREGTYHAAGIRGYYDSDEYSSPEFHVSRDVKVWEVRTAWRNRPVLVPDEHLRPLADGELVGLNVAKDFGIPYQGPRPIWIVE